MKKSKEIKQEIKHNYNIVNNGRKYLNVPELWKKAGKPEIFICISGRSTGKTYSMQKFLYEECKDGNKQFVILSRNLNESHLKKKMYFDSPDVVNDEDGLGTYRNKTNNEIMGYTLSLHLYNTYKSVGDFHKVKYILFEEFIELDLLEYWENEISMFNSIISTIGRNRDDYTIFLLGNNYNEESKSNIYFKNFGISDFDALELEQGHGKIIYEKNNYRCYLYYGGMGFIDDSQMGIVGFLPNNSVATTGLFEESYKMFKTLKKHNVNIEIDDEFDDVCFVLNDFIFMGRAFIDGKHRNYFYTEPIKNKEYEIIELYNEKIYNNIIENYEINFDEIYFETGRAKAQYKDVFNIKNFNDVFHKICIDNINLLLNIKNEEFESEVNKIINNVIVPLCEKWGIENEIISEEYFNVENFETLLNSLMFCNFDYHFFEKLQEDISKIKLKENLYKIINEIDSENLYIYESLFDTYNELFLKNKKI